jgi:hypothetical protein
MPDPRALAAIARAIQDLKPQIDSALSEKSTQPGDVFA